MRPQTEFAPPVLPGDETVRSVMQALASVADVRQQAKVRYPIWAIVLLVLVALCGNAKSWREIEEYGILHRDLLKERMGIRCIPSHDTIQRVMGQISTDVLCRVYEMWCEEASLGDLTPENVKKALKGKELRNADGKTIRGCTRKGLPSAPHVETVWDPHRGVCVGQAVVDQKSNEITALPRALANVDLTNCVLTSDAMCTQKNIARMIVEDKGGDYVLAAKGNHSTVYKQSEEYAADSELLGALEKHGHYTRSFEKITGGVVKREWWVSDAEWVQGKEKWAGLQSVVFERTTVKKDGKCTAMWRYFISSLPQDVAMLAACIRAHWQIEVMHYTLDVTFKEDANKTLDRTAAVNLNVLRKWALTMVRHVDIGKQAHLPLKRYSLNIDPRPVLALLLPAA